MGRRIQRRKNNLIIGIYIMESNEFQLGTLVRVGLKCKVEHLRGLKGIVVERSSQTGDWEVYLYKASCTLFFRPKELDYFT